MGGGFLDWGNFYSEEDKMGTPRKFWMVWVHDTPTTQHRHPSYELASQEADRLAQKNRGKKVYILEAREYRWIEPSPITTVTL